MGRSGPLHRELGQIPKGDHGAGAWINDPVTVKRVRELYKPSAEMRVKMEDDRGIFMAAEGKITEGMILGADKNTYVSRSFGPQSGPRSTISIRLRDPINL